MSRSMDAGELSDEGVLAVKGRTSIDTRRPFRSVKEAVSIFGEVVLACEIYANLNNIQQQTKTKASSGEARVQKKNGPHQMQQDHHSRDKVWQSINAELATSTKTTIDPQKLVNQNAGYNSNDHQRRGKVVLETELEETKRNLQRAREEGELMFSQVESLRKELDQAKAELQRIKSQKHDHFTTHIKQRDHHHQHPQNETSPMIVMNPEIEEIKFVENNTSNSYADEWRKQEEWGRGGGDGGIENDDEDDEFEFPQTKKMQVRFASPPSLIRELSGPDDKKAVLVDKVGSFRKREITVDQKNASVSFVRWFFPKKKKINKASA